MYFNINKRNELEDPSLLFDNCCILKEKIISLSFDTTKIPKILLKLIQLLMAIVPPFARYIINLFRHFNINAI